MRRNLLRILLLVLAPAPFAAAIDFTPTVSEYTAEGITFRQLTFKDGKRQVIYEPPRLWSYRAGGNSLQLAPPKIDRAEAIIHVIEAKAAPKWDDKALNAFKEQFLSSLPPGSQSVTVVSEEQNPVSLENSGSYGVTASYRVLGEIFFRSVVFVNLPELQLTFRLTARKADFEMVQRQFRSSIFSWHWVDSSSPKSLAQKDQPSAETSRQ